MNHFIISVDDDHQLIDESLINDDHFIIRCWHYYCHFSLIIDVDSLIRFIIIIDRLLLIDDDDDLIGS